MSLSQLEKRAVYLEGKYQEYLRKDSYLGKNSRVQRMHDELNGIWQEINARTRLARGYRP